MLEPFPDPKRLLTFGPNSLFGGALHIAPTSRILMISLSHGGHDTDGETRVPSKRRGIFVQFS